jgi:hypothetical protein
MSLAVADAEVVEKRALPRQRVLLRAILAFGGHAFTPEAVIRNMTSGGAAVRLEPGLALPSRLHLIELSSGRAHEARVVWQRNGFVGLELLETRELASAGAGDPLRQLWVDRQPRVRP